MNTFISTFKEMGEVNLPEFAGTRVMMMPIILGNIESVPDTLEDYKDVLEAMFDMQDHHGKVGYLTIDERELSPCETLRRGGAHVDGLSSDLQGAGPWGGGYGGGGKNHPDDSPEPFVPSFDLGSGYGTGMLTVSNPAGCKAWKQEFEGWPGPDGECDHLRDQFEEDNATLLKENTVYWCDPLCVHESLPMTRHTKRQFLRLSMPSPAPWHEGYTENPLGVKPTGPILGRRKYMDA